MTILQNFRLPLVLFAAIGSALTAGIFFAFSTFVMQALAEQPSAPGIATMQSINITVINPWFMVAFFGPAVAGLVLTLAAVPQWNQPGVGYWLAGSLLYLIGTIVVTIAGNIPLNDALASVSPASTEGTMLWAKYLTDWTFWNHVRTIAAFLAAALFTLSLCQRTGLPT
ncbi:MAG: anthrone oxygenase family protein [Cyanobacteria bacterium J06626_18]